MVLIITALLVTITRTFAQFLPQALPVVPLQPRTVVNPLIVPQSVGIYPGGRSAVSPFLPRRGAACAVSGFQMQNNFDLRSFMGQWYLIDDIGIETLDKVNPSTRATDVKAFYALNEDGTITIYTTGRRGFSTTCRNQIGIGRRSGTDPAKHLLSFPNAATGETRGPNPFWVAWTDYQSALIYSCRKLLPDGSCNPASTFSWTLSRDPCGHRPAAECAIVQKRLSLCLPMRFRPADKTVSCPRINPYTFRENTPGSMAVPGSPFYNPVRRDPELPADGPERYVCRVASNNPVPNAVSITIKPKCYTQNAACPLRNPIGSRISYGLQPAPIARLPAYNPGLSLQLNPTLRSPLLVLQIGLRSPFGKKKKK